MSSLIQWANDLEKPKPENNPKLARQIKCKEEDFKPDPDVCCMCEAYIECSNIDEVMT